MPRTEDRKELMSDTEEIEMSSAGHSRSSSCGHSVDDATGAHQAAPKGPPHTTESRCIHTLLIDGAEPGLQLSASELEEGGTPLANRMRRAPDWAITVNNVAYMAVPRSIPANFAATGWVLGIVSLVYSSIVTYDTGLLIGELTTESGAKSFPELSAEALGRFASRQGWREHNRRRARRWAHGLTLGMQFVTYYLTEVCELIYFEQYFGQIFESSALCQWQWMIIGALIGFPVMQVPTFHEGRWMAVLLGVVPLSFNVIIFFYEILLVQPWACEPGPTSTLVPPSAQRAFVGLTAVAYAYGGHGVYPEEVREMTAPSRWPRVMRNTYAVVIPLYWACGLLGYYAYGESANANINANFPPNLPNFASIAVQMVQQVYFLYSTNLVLMLAIELAVGLDPSVACAPPWHGLPPWVGRLLCRGALFGSQVFVGQMLLAGEGDTLIALQSLIGAVGMTAFTYFLPYILLLLMLPERVDARRRAWCVANIALGTVVMFAGIYFSLDELISSSAGFFAGDCRLAYAYAPTSPDDPCFETYDGGNLTMWRKLR